MKSRSLVFVAAFACAMSAGLMVTAQEQKKNEPPAGQMSGTAGMANEEMNKRGDHVMGFDHTKTTHHFRLLEGQQALR